jgi:HJR/Mrr/RecB family endonuclease
LVQKNVDTEPLKMIQGLKMSKKFRPPTMYAKSQSDYLHDYKGNLITITKSKEKETNQKFYTQKYKQNNHNRVSGSPNITLEQLISLGDKQLIGYYFQGIISEKEYFAALAQKHQISKTKISKTKLKAPLCITLGQLINLGDKQLTDYYFQGIISEKEYFAALAQKHQISKTELKVPLYNKEQRILAELMENNQDLISINRIADNFNEINTVSEPNSLLTTYNNPKEYDIPKIQFQKSQLSNEEDIEEMLAKLSSKPKYYIKATNSFSAIAIGIKYENHIASILSTLGFKVSTTPITQDFGIDIIAHKNEIIIAIQCKFWLELVGVNAVQEAFAGKYFYGATHAVVISNSEFTKNAKTLANKIGVKLINQKLNNNITELTNFVKDLFN